MCGVAWTRALFDGHSTALVTFRATGSEFPKGMRPWPSSSAAASGSLARFSCWFQQDFLGVEGSGEETY